ncbi:MAG: ferrochelatase [Euryarchaeota archaeon]|nr:ferrochelatase [Euryarchaeota archaeon]
MCIKSLDDKIEADTHRLSYFRGGMTRGVVLINVGTPDEPTTPAVRRYLKEFLLDPDVIDIPAPIRHLLVRGIILNTRPRKVAPKYASIWMNEGAPLRVYTQRICEALHQDSQIEFEVGMRYGNPTIRGALERLRDRGVTDLLIAPLFPHHAQATTETALKQTYRDLKKINWSPRILELGDFPIDPGFIEPLVDSIRPHINESNHLLFSYHGLPLSHIRRIDKTGSHCLNDGCCKVKDLANKKCYAHQCMMTSMAVAGSLKLPESRWSHSYQSRLGPAKWLSPATSRTVEELAEKGIKDLVIVSPAFVADGLETLEELEIEVKEEFVAAGGHNVKVVPCLNDREDWIKGLERIILQAFDLDIKN